MRILQFGFGNIGREVWEDYRTALANDEYMVIDKRVDTPEGYVWDRKSVDLAVLLVNTPQHPLGMMSGPDGLDYRELIQAVYEALEVAEFVLIRSTIGPEFLTSVVYRHHADRIGFSPEFYGATKWSRRGVVDLDFTILTENVPEWFAARMTSAQVLRVTPVEAAIAKLAENAYLATKVTFFHELFLICEKYGADYERVREAVTVDPRINPHHSAVEELGWQSHCFDKDVPAFAQLSRRAGGMLATAMLQANEHLLSERSWRSGSN